MYIRFLNWSLVQVVHLWGYESLEQRAGVRAKLKVDATWNSEYFQRILPWLLNQASASHLSLTLRGQFGSVPSTYFTSPLTVAFLRKPIHPLTHSPLISAGKCSSYSDQRHNISATGSANNCWWSLRAEHDSGMCSFVLCHDVERAFASALGFLQQGGWIGRWTGQGRAGGFPILSLASYAGRGAFRMVSESFPHHTWFTGGSCAQARGSRLLDCGAWQCACHRTYASQSLACFAPTRTPDTNSNVHACSTR